MQRRRLAAIATLPMAGFLLLAFPAAAAASIGVGIQVGPVRLAGIAHAGQTYDLPPVYVVNTGTEPETVRLDVQRLSKGTGRDVPKPGSGRARPTCTWTRGSRPRSRCSSWC